MTMRAKAAWIGGFVAGLAAFVVLIDQVTFDRELQAAEQRVVESQESSDREILEQVLTQQRLAIAQQQAQYLTLRKELLSEQIERLTDKLIMAPASEHWWINDRIEALQKKLDLVEQKLEAHLLGAVP